MICICSIHSLCLDLLAGGYLMMCIIYMHYTCVVVLLQNMAQGFIIFTSVLII